MFYNYCRSTRACLFNEQQKKKLKKRQISLSHSPNSRLMNLQKRQKLKNLLMMKFMEKYNINYPEQSIEKEITKFIQREKLTDRDLQRLNNKIQKLAKNTSDRNILENKMNQELKSPVNPDNKKNYFTEELINNNNKKNAKLNDENFTEINNLNNTLYPRNDVISLPKVTGKMEPEPKKLKHSQSSMNIANNTYTLFPKYNYLTKKLYKSPEEELAELEKELEIKNYQSKDNKRIDFSKEGNEWSAITKYKQKLYEKQLKEERLRENEMKKRTKEDLDNQIKFKLMKEYEETIKDKEFDKVLIDKLKKMDEIDKIKAEKIKNQMIKEKERQEQIFKNEMVRKKIEILKEKKRDKEIVKNAKERLQKDLTDRYIKKKKLNESLNKAIKEMEIKKIKMKQLIKRQKEDERTYLKEQQKTDDKKDKERQKIFDKIYFNSNKCIMRNAEELAKRNQESQKKEEEKIEFYMEEKRKALEEKERKEKMRQKEQRKELKKFLDMQVEEKNKEKSFLKNLEYEQARIWNVDLQRYQEDEKIIDNKIKKMNRKNLEFIIKQMKEKNHLKKDKINSDMMTNDEYDMNRELLEKAKNTLNEG